MRAKSCFTPRILFVAMTFGSLLVLGALWLSFHAAPRESTLKTLLDRADHVEIFRFKDGSPTRWVRFDERHRWADLSELLRYRGTFWGFSREPKDTIVLQTIEGESTKSRRLALEVRGDGRIHLRKAARWYRMPVEPEFEARIRELLREEGRDLTDEDLATINAWRPDSFSP